MNKKYVYLLLNFLLLSLNKAISSKESLIEEQMHDLPHYREEKISKFLIEEEKFESLFPKRIFKTPTVEETDESLFVGQIEKKDTVGLGTGYLYDVYVKEGQLRGVGFTTFHTFFYINAQEGNKYIINRDCTFFINRKATSSTEHKIIDYGRLKIDSVKFDFNEFQRDKTSRRDICLFEGTISAPEEIYYFQDPANFIKFFNNTKVQNPLHDDVEELSETIQGCIYHFPFGKKEMRINRGSVSSNNSHKINTLTGSSGAPIFHINSGKNKIIGIHIGSHTSISNKLAYYTDLNNKEYIATFTDTNRFEYFSSKDYDYLLASGKDLYTLNSKEIGLLQIKLIEESNEEFDQFLQLKDIPAPQAIPVLDQL